MATDILNDNPRTDTPEESHGFSLQATTALGPTLVALLKPLASLKLTVALLAMSIFIVLAGTMAQVDKDIWQVVDEYFRCLVAWIDLQIFFPPSFLPSKPNIPDWMVIPFPGGWLIGTLMFLNLAAAHGLRFKPQASGARLWGGFGVIGLGGLTTWLVVVSGASSDGIQAESWISWGSIWLLFKLGLTATVAAMFNMLRKLRPKDSTGTSPFEFVKSTQGIVGTACSVGLAILTFWLWYEGEDAQLDDSSMRILWQLIQGGLSGLVLLAGCWLVFQKRAGIVLIHAGILLLMFGELLVGRYAVEEQMAIEEGYGRGDERYELAQLSLAVRRIGRYIAGISLHTQGMTYDEAVKLFEEQCWMKPVNAAREARRGTMDPTYLVYTLGKWRILELREELRAKHGARFRLREFHDAFLRQGPSALPVVRTAMLREFDPKNR